jgi:hypothetical protein
MQQALEKRDTRSLSVRSYPESYERSGGSAMTGKRKLKPTDVVCPLCNQPTPQINDAVKQINDIMDKHFLGNKDLDKSTIEMYLRLKPLLSVLLMQRIMFKKLFEPRKVKHGSPNISVSHNPIPTNSP